ncbi:MAG TPA: hypothetical protein VGQ36_25105 [Thermoanaerobaculia bacterium]|nr:hypothetical protein [Thermoanaerobaculia bacterium]
MTSPRGELRRGANVGRLEHDCDLRFETSDVRVEGRWHDHPGLSLRFATALLDFDR